MTYSIRLCLVALAVLGMPTSGSAQESCGDIISINPYSGETEQVTIENCSDPFAPNTPVPEDLGLLIDGVEVSTGEVSVAVPTEYFSSVMYNQELRPTGGFWYGFQLFTKQGDDYVQVDLRPPSAQDIDLETGVVILEAFFTDDPDLALYREAYISDDTTNLTIEQEVTYYDFLFDHLEQVLFTEYKKQLPLGDYWFVFTQQVICLVQADTSRSFLARVGEFLIPRAHAQQLSACNPGYVPERFVVPLEITQVEIVPTGASSVLFLPGIQASRLYKQRILIGEDQLWEPSVNRGQDVRQLRFNDDGESAAGIYTKVGDVIDTADFIPGKIDNVIVYETWLERLDQEKTAGTIPQWQALAYDWRYDVFDVVRDGIVAGPPDDQQILHPLEELERLSESSPNNKVSIIAHSNGGLLAKAMLIEADKLCRENPDRPCLIDRVDQLILLGSPQLGTPEGLKSMLHGGDDSFREGFVVPASDFRSVARTLPGAHTLLPADDYLEGLSFPTISFMGGSPYFEQFRQAYPNGIRTKEQLTSFLLGEEGREDVNYYDLNRPIKLDRQQLEDGQDSLRLLADWIVPDGIKVTEVVGVGVPTVSQLRYDSFLQTVRSVSGVPGEFDLTKLRLGMTLYGDETVMARSAEGYEGEKDTYYVDLQIYNELAAEVGSVNLPAAHSNLTEPADVQDLLVRLLSNSTELESSYVSDTLPNYEGQSYDGLSTFSPVDLLIVDTAGNRTGVVQNEQGVSLIVQEIPNSRFFLIGSSSHAYIPSDTEYEVVISGYDEGSFSVVIEDIVEGQELITSFRLENIISTTNTTAKFQKDGGEFSDLAIDRDGDGSVDEVRTLDGSSITVIAEESLENPPSISSGSGSSATRVTNRLPAPQVLGIATSDQLSAEQMMLLVLIISDIQELLDSQVLTAKNSDILSNTLMSIASVLEKNKTL